MFSSQDLDVPTCPHLKAANFTLTIFAMCRHTSHVDLWQESAKVLWLFKRLSHRAEYVENWLRNAAALAALAAISRWVLLVSRTPKATVGQKMRCHIQSPLQPVTSAAKDRQYCKWCTFASISALKNSRCIAQNIALLCSSKNQLLLKELSSDFRFFGKFTAWGLISIWKIMHWILQNWSCWRTWP